jgi:putative MATE family efflux protein
VESAVAERVTEQSEGKTDSRATAPHEGRLRTALRLRHPFDREILALAVPALGTLAADPLVSLVDTAFVGRLGVVPLAALGVNASIFSLAFLVFNFLAYGTTPMVARAVGAGDRDRAGRLAVEALTLAVVAGFVAVAVLQLLAVPIVHAMGATGELVAPAVEYLRIRALAGPAVLVITASNGIFRGWQDTRTPFVVALVLNAVNLVLDPVLIFGLGWGLAGAATATAVAQWTGAVAFLWLILGTRREAFGVRPLLPRPRDLLPFLSVGGALIVRTFSLVGTMTLATAVATRVGTVAVAAHLVASQLWLMLALLVDALAVAGQAIVGRLRGAGQAGDVARAADRLVAWGLGVGIVLALGFLALEPWLPRLFTDDAVAIDATRTVLPFVIAMQPLNALVFVGDGIYMGAEEFRFLAAQMVASALAACIVLLFVVPMGWGLQGVWWGIVALMLVRAGTLAGRYGRVFGAPSPPGE